MGERYYDATAGRFLSGDTAWPQTDDWAGLNPYLYAAANPLKYVDPDGRFCWKVVEWLLKQGLKQATQEAAQRMMKIAAKRAKEDVGAQLAESQTQSEMDKARDEVASAALDVIVAAAKDMEELDDTVTEKILNTVNPFAMSYVLAYNADIRKSVETLKIMEQSSSSSEVLKRLRDLHTKRRLEECPRPGPTRVLEKAIELVRQVWIKDHGEELMELVCIAWKLGIRTPGQLQSAVKGRIPTLGVYKATKRKSPVLAALLANYKNLPPGPTQAELRTALRDKFQEHSRRKRRRR